MKKINVLISAYAVSPNHGSEPGMGWNWIIQIAKYCNVYVITESEFKEEIEEALLKINYKSNLTFYYNDIGQKARNMCWNQGDYRFYFFYRKWQQATLQIAKNIISEHKIDIIHQLNMIGYREPGYLWKIKDIPFVWGPVGGFNFVPFRYLTALGFKNAGIYSIKNILNFVQACTHYRVRKAVKSSSIIFSASGNTNKALQRFYKKESILLNETGCHISKDNIEIRNNKNEKEFNIIWVGRFIPTKMLVLALKTISKLKHLKGLKFHIVGNGISEESSDYYKDYALKLGIDQICNWYGKISQYKVQDLMRKSDLLFFSSVIEGTSHVVLESVSNLLPVLCFDTCGHGEIITEEIGRKIKLKGSSHSIKSFSFEIEQLYNNRKLLSEMSNNCKLRINKLTWESKGEFLFSKYNELL